MSNTKIRHPTIALSIHRLNNGDIDFVNLPEYVIYTDYKSERLLENGISDSLKVDITYGTKLYLCKNQYIDFKDYSGKLVLKVHFTLTGIGHDNGCSCGSCGYSWSISDGKCDCEKEIPIDPKNEPCVIS